MNQTNESSLIKTEFFHFFL